MSKRRATINRTTKETDISLTLSLAAVFIPVLFMGGIVGRLFHEFAVTLSVAIGISLLVSLPVTPMLASRWLRPQARPASRPHHPSSPARRSSA